MVLKHGIFIGKYRLQRVGFRIAESGAQAKNQYRASGSSELYRCRYFDHAGVKTRFEQSAGIFADLVAFCGFRSFAAKRVCHYGQIGRCGRYRQIGRGTTLIAVSADYRFIHAFS